MTELHILQLDQSLSTIETQMFLGLVSEPFRERIQKFYHEEDLQRSLIGKALTRSVLSAKTGRSNEHLTFRTDFYGKPHLEPEQLYFNRSHSGIWVCLAIATTPVGVDVEGVTPMDLTDAAPAMNAREIRFLELQPEQTRLKQLYSIWTARESYVKYLGMGLSTPPESFSISLESEKAMLVCTDTENVPSLHSYEMSDGSPVTLCVDCPVPPTPIYYKLSAYADEMLRILYKKN